MWGLPNSKKTTIKMVHMTVSTVIFLKPFDSFVLETDQNLKLNLSRFLTQSYCVSPEVLQYSTEMFWTKFCIVIWCFLCFLELRRFWTLYAFTVYFMPSRFQTVRWHQNPFVLSPSRACGNHPDVFFIYWIERNWEQKEQNKQY